MSVLFRRLFLAALLATAPAFAMAQSDGAEVETEETTASAEDAGPAEDATGDDDTPEDGAELSEEDAWAAKLRKRHHEGDVALGVCGARMTALMWFYQSSVADGRDDLKPAYDAIRESRTIVKNEAERRAVEDGIGTSVSVMNEHSAELWKALIEASEEPEAFQETHDEIFAGVQECLSLFFNRAAASAQTGPEDPAEEPGPGSGDAEEKTD